MKKLLILCLFVFVGCGPHLRIPNWWPIAGVSAPLPLGVFDFKISKNGTGTKFPVTLVFSFPLPKDTRWLMKDINRGRYIEVPMKLDQSRRRIALELWDGGMFDLLHTRDGMVIHLGGPSYEEVPKIVA